MLTPSLTLQLRRDLLVLLIRSDDGRMVASHVLTGDPMFAPADEPDCVWLEFIRARYLIGSMQALLLLNASQALTGVNAGERVLSVTVPAYERQDHPRERPDWLREGF